MALYITPFGQMVRGRSLDDVMDAFFTKPESRLHVPMNVKADENGYHVTALLPGVKAEDLTVQVQQNTLTIEGEVHSETTEKDNYLLFERSYGKFSRMIRLPELVDSSKVEAELKDGVLSLRIPKAEEARPKKIKISMN